VVQVQVPVFLMRQIFVKLVPRLTVEPSGKVTSVMKEAASHLDTGWMGGTDVNVSNAIGVDVNVGMESVTVGDVSCTAVIVPCVDMAPKVSAAAVYMAFNVAAGMGAFVVKGPHARMVPSARTKRRIFLKRVKDMGNSNLNIDHLVRRFNPPAGSHENAEVLASAFFSMGSCSG
jgi:hypothetical protein